ncbi:MAG: permease-like cell division protein FtsX [Patescibacteria group bacterium]
MFITSFKRVIRNAFISFWRNGWVSLATILVMVLAIFMVGSLILFLVLLESTLQEVEKKVDVTVYFKVDAAEVDTTHIQDLLTRMPEVKSVEYITREESLRRFKERHKDNSLISSALDELGQNPLGASLRVQATSPESYGSIANFLESGNFDSIDKVNYKQNQRVFERLANVLNMSRRIGIGISLVLGFIAFLVAFNTISLAIYTARDEIGVMRLVGASSWYVRGPFLVEGVIHGFFSSIIAMLIFWPITLWAGPKARDFFAGVDLYSYYTQNFIQFFLVLFLVGIVLGVFSSFIATRRYLKI